MKFNYFAGEQRTQEWFDKRLGIPSASNLGRWLAVSKAKDPKVNGTPLKARADYERELMFERTFKKPFTKFVSGAMQEGIDMEEFAREQYTKITKRVMVPVGMWFNEWFCASPDGGVDDKGLGEIKWLKDTHWTDVLESNAPLDDHWKQMQGQLFASGRAWVDYIAGNLNTKKFIIIRVLPDKEFFKELEASLKKPLTVEAFNTKNVFDFVDELPEGNLLYMDEGGTQDFSDF